MSFKLHFEFVEKLLRLFEDLLHLEATHHDMCLHSSEEEDVLDLQHVVEIGEGVLKILGCDEWLLFLALTHYLVYGYLSFSIGRRWGFF